MNVIDWLLNLAALVLWIDWRSGRSARPESVLSIASAVRPAERRVAMGFGSLATLLAILLIRPFVYHSIGPAMNWTASTNFLAISIPWRSDFLGRIFIFSTLSFAVTIAFYYSWLLLLSAIHRSSNPASDEEVVHRFIHGQLGWLDKLPWWLKLLTPSLVAAASWTALSYLLVGLELLPSVRSDAASRTQAAAFALSAILTWKWLLILIFLVHLLNLYVYLGAHPLWTYLSATARKLLFPFSFLRFGRVDLSPVIGIVVVFVAAEFFLKPLVTDIFQRHIV